MKKAFPESIKDHFLSKENFTLSKVPPYGILKTEPQPHPENIGAYYESEAYLSHDDSASGLFAYIYRTVKKINLTRKGSLLKKYNRQIQSVLDVGCGTGDFLHTLPDTYSKTGVEVNPKAASLAKQKGLKITDDLFKLDSKFDVITLWHVLEHLYQPDQVFEKLNTNLKENGTLFIALPNYKSWDAQYYKSQWAGYDVPRHLWHYDQSAIEKICHAHQMEVVKILPMFFDAYYVSLLSEKYKENSLSMLRAIITGSISNLSYLFTGQCSSQIYIIRKKIK